jgi:hypothetical protein
MAWNHWSAGALVAGVVALAVLSGGCGPAENKTDKPSQQADKDKHSGWWCAEHGMPEKECSMCQDEVAKSCKAKGDWCEKHDRAKSQCFKCDPALREKFAARYRAKYGKEPPPIEEEAEGQPKKESKD